jgi:nitroreductase
MSDLIDLLKSRRSVRRFEEKDIPENLLSEILESVQWSPSWANTQCWEIVVVKDSAVKEKLQETIVPKNPATKAITGAPVVLALCGKLGISGYYKDIAVTKFGDWYMFDLGIACQSICLSAHPQGLGTVVVGLFDHLKAKQVLGIDEAYELVTLIPMGYTAKIPPAPKRKDINDFVHYDSF